MIIGYLNLPNFVTFLSMALSVMAGYFALNDLFPLAIDLMLIVVILDAVDGYLARKMNRDKSESVRQYGHFLDNGADLINYSLAPILLGVAVGNGYLVDWIIYVFFTLCLASRLAYFSVVGTHEKGGGKYFMGLPSTYASVFLPIGITAGDLLSPVAMFYIVRLMFILLGVLFILKIPVKDIRSTKIPLVVIGGIIGPASGIYWLLKLF